MRHFAFILYFLLIVVLGIATFVESAKGSSFVQEHIYHSVPFILLWGVLSVLMIFSLWKKKFFQAGPKILLHFAFVVILIGALTSYLTSKKGMMHLRMGEPTFQFVEEGTRRVLDLPFTLTLDTFFIDYYPGTEAPADYVSIVTSDELRATSGHAEQDSSCFTLHASLTHTISMNNILTHEGFRFYQSSFDEDRRGSWLSVNYDPWGTGITYVGYILLVIAMIGVMVHPKGGFRRLLRTTSDEQRAPKFFREKNIRTKESKGIWEKFLCPSVLMSKKRKYSLLVACILSLVVLLIFLVDKIRVDELTRPCETNSSSTCQLVNLSTQSAFAQETKKLSILSLEEAEGMKRMQVIHHDRVVPLNTLARDFVRKLYGKDSFSGLTPEQILLSWQRHPGEWAYVPAIKIKSEALRTKLGLEGKYARMVDLFEMNGGRQVPEYKLRAINETLHGQDNSLKKAVREVDEKVALVMMLERGTLIRPLPEDGSVQPLSKSEVEAELLYNCIPFTKILFMFNLTMGLVLLIVDKVQVDKLTRPCGTNPSSTCQLVNSSTKILFLFALLFHLTGYLLRWYIGGRIPLSNGNETMLFLALCIMVLAWTMRRRFAPALAFGFLLSGFALLVAYLGEMNPQITPLMPVLVSPWLSLHVSVIMMSYALFAFIMLNGVWALCVPREAERLRVYSQLMLYPAVFLLAAGIFIGAVWANVSWGRYWGWDPKEVWALISLLIYAYPLHRSSLSCGKGTKSFHIYMVVAFLSILMTYFGVNFFLGGMHSYA